ncbi:MAG: 4Fe-4S dicluster domain-containing protein [Dehalococcoidia bacterium]|nr:4Fe-4S dicluster domain-containing protein [Dehalococcoidia bacterium]
MFKADLCDLCGDCLVKCPWIKVDKPQAVEWMKAMMAGQQTSVLRRCITCFACNEICPTKANPFDLIARLQEQYDVFNSKEIAKLEEANYAFTKTLTKYPSSERIMTACLFQKTHPHLMQGQLYDLPRVSGKPYFCWLLFGHWGVESIQKKHAREMVDRLALTGAKEVICFHDDCYAMLATLAPGYGIEVPFRPVHLSEYLLSRLQQHRDRIKPLNISVAYQRPCASRLTPVKEHFVDELFELAGVTRVRRTYDRDGALCCANIKLLLGDGDPRPDQEKNILDAKQSGAQAMVCLCPMCLDGLAAVASVHGLPLIFLGDIARMALGEIAVPALGGAERA